MSFSVGSRHQRPEDWKPLANPRETPAERKLLNRLMTQIEAGHLKIDKARELFNEESSTWRK